MLIVCNINNNIISKYNTIYTTVFKINQESLIEIALCCVFVATSIIYMTFDYKSCYRQISLKEMTFGVMSITALLLIIIIVD